MHLYGKPRFDQRMNKLDHVRRLNAATNQHTVLKNITCRIFFVYYSCLV